MLTAPVSDPALRPGWAGEPKWDGFRAAVRVDAGRVVLRSRRGTEMATSFPELLAGAVQLPDATAMDGELVVWDAAGRLAFKRLQNRPARRGAGADRAAQEWPAHFVAFDESPTQVIRTCPADHAVDPSTGPIRKVGKRGSAGPGDSWRAGPGRTVTGGCPGART
ncbi:hypothetical protein [Streptomyces sp. NPDC088156]